MSYHFICETEKSGQAKQNFGLSIPRSCFDAYRLEIISASFARELGHS